jgi:hemolysin activation/secretion protein
VPRLRLASSRIRCLLLVFALLVPSVRARGQAIQRPGDERPELPKFEAPRQEEPVLPPIPQPAEPRETPSSGPGVFVKDYRFVGSTVFSDAELEAVVAPWAGRVIRSEDLVSVRNAVTELYLKHGYVNSGATLPDQDFEGGVIEIQIIEGTLAEIRVTGNRHFRSSYLSQRIWRGATTPLEIGKLSEQVEILQQDPRIEKIAARLVPGERRGEAILDIDVEETSRYGVDLRFSNHEPPSIGALAGQVEPSLENLVGWGDELRGEFTITDGLERYRGRYEIPFSRWDTRLLLEARYAESKVTEDPFDVLDIESSFQSYEIGLIQPVYRSPQTQLELSVLGDWRQSRTQLLGEDFSFPGSGAHNGKATASVLRFAVDWLRRDQNQVFAARAQLSWGIDVLGATTNGGGQPDGRFVAGLLQLQWARRFGSLGIETIVRGDLQLANDPLLTLEQFAVGGYATVRGYRENQRVQDEGAVVSLEVRVPIWRDPRYFGVVELAPFVDYGHVWNQADRPDKRAKTLASAGIGLRWRLPRFVSAQIYWGQNFNSVDTSGNLQDHGVMFLVDCHLP